MSSMRGECSNCLFSQHKILSRTTCVKSCITVTGLLNNTGKVIQWSAMKEKKNTNTHKAKRKMPPATIYTALTLYSWVGFLLWINSQATLIDSHILSFSVIFKFITDIRFYVLKFSIILGLTSKLTLTHCLVVGNLKSYWTAYWRKNLN